MIFATTDLINAGTFSQQLLTAIGPYIIVILGGFAAMIANSVKNYVNAHTTKAQQDILYNIAQQAVLAAEQLGINGDISDKKLYAENLIDQYLVNHGFKFTAEEIEAAIEASVVEAFNAPATTTTVTTPTTTTTVETSPVGASAYNVSDGS